MSPAQVLDKYYLSITLLVTVGYQLLGFAIAWTFQFDKITDFTGGSNFFILALMTLLMGNTYHARNIVTSVFVMVWAARLAGFLLFRVLKTGSDARFDDIRSHFFKFMGFWIGQSSLVWTVSLPLIILNSPAVSDLATGGANPKFGTARDIVGIVLWVVGWVIESVADIQKYQYKSSNPPKDRPIQTGLWKWSRHPPYFGEMLCWWGIWTLCLSPTTNGGDPGLPNDVKAAQRGSVVSPVFTFLLLMFVSGVPTAEKPTAKKFILINNTDDDDNEPTHPSAWSKYTHYLASTSILVPIPPRVYRPLPRWVKRSVLLDFPMYGFDGEEGEEGRKGR
ncbi:hypothetical protein BDY19DRAFT_886174 [Irpex rosettiformis]|uniref:Uncharacterized protein n=1 Tax=Irpex rosettiformis TaxID=378272 RepID=A0ACB8U9C1_9APHY|nr:hypothetical protein BDY19DRAFT_886174 [Irpex rosettiformis]